MLYYQENFDLELVVMMTTETQKVMEKIPKETDLMQVINIRVENMNCVHFIILNK